MEGCVTGLDNQGQDGGVQRSTCMIKRWKENSEDLINEENVGECGKGACCRARSSQDQCR